MFSPPECLNQEVCAPCRYYWEQLFPTSDEALAAHYNGSGARDNRVAQVNLC